MNATGLYHHTFLVLTVLLMSALALLTPAWTRRDVFFGVTVSKEFLETAAARALLRGYRLRVLAISVLALAVAVAGLLLQQAWLGTAGVALAVSALFFGYAWAHLGTREHRAEGLPRRTVTLAPGPELPRISPLLQLLPFVLLAAAGGVLALQWEALPQSFPVHWNLQGEADRFASRSVASVFGPLFSGIFTCALIGALAHFTLTRTKRVASTPELAESDARQRSTVHFGLVGIGLWMALLFSTLALLPLLPGGAFIPRYLGTASILFAVVVLIWIVRLARIRSRIHQAGNGDATSDRYWKFGFIYVNPEDPALLVEKRFGIGYTANFANRLTWLLFAALVLPQLILALTLAALQR